MNNTELPGRRTARGPRREHSVKERLAGSLVIGAVIAAALVAFEGRYRHAALAASAARPLPHGGHQSVASVLASGFVGAAVVVTVVVFVISTVAAYRRRARQRALWRGWDGDREPRRRGRAGSWR